MRKRSFSTGAKAKVQREAPPASEHTYYNTDLGGPTAEHQFHRASAAQEREVEDPDSFLQVSGILRVSRPALKDLFQVVDVIQEAERRRKSMQ